MYKFSDILSVQVTSKDGYRYNCNFITKTKLKCGKCQFGVLEVKAGAECKRCKSKITDINPKYTSLIYANPLFKK